LQSLLPKCLRCIKNRVGWGFAPALIGEFTGWGLPIAGFQGNAAWWERRKGIGKRGRGMNSRDEGEELGKVGSSQCLGRFTPIDMCCILCCHVPTK